MPSSQPFFDAGRAHSKLLDRYVPLIPAGPILDLGCGPGHDAIYLAERGFDVIAVDRSPDALAALGGRREILKGGGRIAAIEQDLALSFPDAGEPGAILALNVLHFLRPARAAEVIALCLHSLRPGGLLIIRLFAAQNGGAFNFLPAPEGLMDLLETMDMLEFHYYAKSDAHPHPHTHWIIDAVAAKKGGDTV